MSISYVGSQGNAGTTVTIPTHQSGDLILIFAYRDGNNAAPGTPAAGGTVPTWNLIGSSGGNTNSSNFRWALATGSTTTSGTWTNATELVCLVYRGAKVVGNSAGSSGNASTTVTYPALTLDRTDNSSWVVGVAGHRTATNVDVAPSGMTNRAFAGTEAAGHDTNGTVASWSQQTVTVNASSASRSWTVELRDATSVVTADAISYSLTGQAASFQFDFNFGIDAASFVFAGQDTGVKATRTITGEAGVFALTGQDATLTYTPVSQNITFSVNAGAFVFTGQDIAAKATRTTSAAKGEFTVDGKVAGVVAERKLTAETAAFTCTAQDASLIATRKVGAEVGAFTFTGVPVGFNNERRIYGQSASFALTGWDATLTHTAINNYAITAESRAFAVSGQSAALKDSRAVQAGAGEFSVVGVASTFKVQRSITGQSVEFAITGQDVTLLAPQFNQYSLSAANGIFTVSGKTAGTTATRKLSGAANAFTVSGKNVSLIDSGRLINASNAAFAFTGNAASLFETNIYILSVDTGSYGLTGQSAAVSKTYVPLVAADAAFGLSGQNNVLSATRKLIAVDAEYALTGQDAVVTRIARRNMLVF